MSTTEWTDLASVPVYPLGMLRRIDASVRPFTVRRFHRTGFRLSLRDAVAHAYPGSLDDVHIKVLPALRAVILFPLSVGHELHGTPVPALILEARMRAHLTRRIGGIRRVFAATYRGYDRYVVSPAGLLACSHVDTVPSDATYVDAFPRPRHHTVQRVRHTRFPLTLGDRTALLIAGTALLVHIAPDAPWEPQPHSGATDVTYAGESDTPSVSREDGSIDLGATVHKLQAIVPDFTLHSILRTTHGYQLTGYTPYTNVDSAELSALSGVTTVRVDQAGNRTEFQITGETP